MIWRETPLAGVWVVDIERHVDARGFFARSWCQQEFREHGLGSTFVQSSISYNAARGTLRGLHFQADPKPESKLVRCTQGAIFDVAVDLRPDSPTFCQWVGVELTAENRRAVYIPAGVAHGFQTLEAASEVFYQMSEFYFPELARGYRWDDPAFQIAWPLPDPILSERDRGYPDFGGSVST
jgi:dTDP-4-dehydrorhamnose 3,5-epimerase